MPTGHVQWFNASSLWGILAGSPEDNIFVHHSAIQMDGVTALFEGDAVEFELIEILGVR